MLVVWYRYLSSFPLFSYSIIEVEEKMERKIELWIACKCINMRAILGAIRDPQLSREMHTTFFQPACCNLNLSNDLVPITFRIRYFTRLINISEGQGEGGSGRGRQTGKSSVSNCIDSNKVGRGRNYVYNYYRAQFPRNNYGLIDIRNRSGVETFPTRSPPLPRIRIYGDAQLISARHHFSRENVERRYH